MISAITILETEKPAGAVGERSRSQFGAVVGVTSPGGWDDLHTALPLRSKCESPWLVSLQQAPSPGLSLHPGTSWSLVRHHDSLGLLSQPLGVESFSSGICTLGAIDTAWLAKVSKAMCETCMCGKARPSHPARVQPKPLPQQADFKIQFGKSGGSMELIEPKPQLSTRQG